MCILKCVYSYNNSYIVGIAIYSHSSNKWSLVPANTKDRLLKVSRSDDGVFWISYEDFCKNFTNFELGSAIEHLNSDTSSKSATKILSTASGNQPCAFNVHGGHSHWRTLHYTPHNHMCAHCMCTPHAMHLHVLKHTHCIYTCYTIFKCNIPCELYQR